MIQNLRKRKASASSGFTIIEVMIVLAIAGLIMLIIFLAVPALQRSSRNTQRKNDAASVASAVANYIDNNGGTLPTKVSDSGSSNLVVGTAAGANSETAKLGYYSTGATGAFGASDGKIYINSTAAVTLVAVGSESSTAVSTESVIIDTGYTCNNTSTGVGTASARSAAILYATENGTTNGSLQCTEQ